MPFWGEIYFIDANSPVMEQLIFFYDHTMVVIVSLVIFLIFFMWDIGLNKVINVGLLDNQFVEIVWTILPIIILIFIAIPSLRVLYLIEEGFDPLISIKIIGNQWFWEYYYEEFQLKLVRVFEEYEFFYQGETDYFRRIERDLYITVPINIIVRLLVRRKDVIHSWTVQSLGVKTDAVPGRLNQLNFYSFKPGIYFGQCSEICGTYHRFIPITVAIVDVESFYDWIRAF